MIGLGMVSLGIPGITLVRTPGVQTLRGVIPRRRPFSLRTL